MLSHHRRSIHGRRGRGRCIGRRGRDYYRFGLRRPRRELVQEESHQVHDLVQQCPFIFVTWFGLRFGLMADRRRSERDWLRFMAFAADVIGLLLLLLLVRWLIGDRNGPPAVAVLVLGGLVVGVVGFAARIIRVTLNGGAT